MVVINEKSVVASPSPNNAFAKYKSSFSSQSGPTKTIRLRKNAPSRSNSYRSARSARSTRAEERVDVEAYNPFCDEREDAEDARSYFSEENSRDLWPPMPVSTAREQDEEFFPETGPTGTPRRKRTGSTPFKPRKLSEGDDDGFTDGFRVSYSSSTPQRTAKSSVSSSNFTNNQSHPFDEFRGASSATTTPSRASKPSVLDKYKPSGGEPNGGFRASYSSPRAERRLSTSSASSKNAANETESSNGFRSSFHSAFTPQRGARLSIGSTHTTQTANDNASVTSASQRSIKSNGVSNKYTANLSQASEKSNAPKLIATPLRSKKKSSVSNRYLSAVASKVQDDLNTSVSEASDLPAKAEVQPKVDEPEKTEKTSNNEPEKPRILPRRSSSFSSASAAAKMWIPKEQPKKAFSPYKRNSIQKAEENNEEKIVESTPAIKTPNSKMWKPKEQPKKAFSAYKRNSIQTTEDDSMEKIVETKLAVEMAKMKAQFDEEVQRIEQRMEEKYRAKIESLEEKFDRMNKVVGKMISKRKSMDNADMDRLEV